MKRPGEWPEAHVQQPRKGWVKKNIAGTGRPLKDGAGITLQQAERKAGNEEQQRVREQHVRLRQECELRRPEWFAA